MTTLSTPQTGLAQRVIDEWWSAIPGVDGAEATSSRELSLAFDYPEPRKGKLLVEVSSGEWSAWPYLAGTSDDEVIAALRVIHQRDDLNRLFGESGIDVRLDEDGPIRVWAGGTTLPEFAYRVYRLHAICQQAVMLAFFLDEA